MALTPVWRPIGGRPVHTGLNVYSKEPSLHSHFNHKQPPEAPKRDMGDRLPTMSEDFAIP
jgi:hypothetical protein